MNTFNDIATWISRQASIFTFVVLGFAGYLWGDELFCCPCKSTWVRCVYSLSLAFSPAFLVFVFDTHWKAARASWKINKCCSSSSFMLFRRPLILSIAWVVYSGIDPKFAECLTQADNCTSEADELKGFVLTAIAGSVLCISCFTFVVCIISNICCMRTFLSRRSHQNDNAEVSSTEEETTLKSHLQGLSPKTLTFLADEDLMNRSQLSSLNPEDFTNMKDKLTMGEIKNLQKICNEMNLPAQGSDKGKTASVDAAVDRSASSSAGHAADSPASHKNEGSRLNLETIPTYQSTYQDFQRCISEVGPGRHLVPGMQPPDENTPLLSFVYKHISLYSSSNSQQNII